MAQAHFLHGSFFPIAKSLLQAIVEIFTFLEIFKAMKIFIYAGIKDPKSTMDTGLAYPAFTPNWIDLQQYKNPFYLDLMIAFTPN